jgi:outer membrane protein
LKSSKLGIFAAASEFFPTVNFSLSTTGEEVSNEGNLLFKKHSVSRVYSLTQPIFSGGESLIKTSKAKHMKRLSSYQLSATEMAIMLETARTYLNILSLQEAVKLHETNVQLLEKHLELAQKKLELGEITNTAVSQTKSRLSSAMAAKIRSYADLKAENNHFKTLVKIEPSDLKAPVFSKDSLPKSLEEAIEIAMKNNPKFLASSEQLDIAKLETKQALSHLSPSADIVFAQSHLPSQQAAVGYIEDKSVTFKLNVPILQRGSQYSAVKVRKIQEAETRLALDQTQQDIEEEVINSWNNLESSSYAVEALKDAVEAANLAFEGIKQEANYGASTNLSVLDSQQELLKVKLELIKAVNNQILSTYALKVSTGMLESEISSKFNYTKEE